MVGSFGKTALPLGVKSVSRFLLVAKIKVDAHSPLWSMGFQFFIATKGSIPRLPGWANKKLKIHASLLLCPYLSNSFDTM